MVSQRDPRLTASDLAGHVGASCAPGVRSRALAAHVFAALLLLLLWLPSQAHAQARLSKDELARLFPGVSLDGLTADELDQCERNPQLAMLMALLSKGTAARQTADSVAASLTATAGATPAPTGPAGIPGAPGAAAGPGFEGLMAVPPPAPVGGSLTDAQLQEAMGADAFASMSARRRDTWRHNHTLVLLYTAYAQGRLALDKLRAMAANLLEAERPPLMTRPDQSLRKQMPLEGRLFSLGLSLSTGLIYIEKDRVAQERDQQIANVYAALADEDHESDIAQELARIVALDHGKKVEILLNLKLLFRGSIGTFGSLDVISLGLANSWLSPNLPIRSLRGVVAHELGHLLQAKLYGYRPTVGLISKFVGMKHDPQVTTTGPLALSEGWGDYCGMSFGKSDYWDWSDAYRHEKGDFARPLKSHDEMLRTEGIVTRILLQAEAKLPGFRRDVIASLAAHKPRDIAALVDGFAADHPAEAATMRGVMNSVLAGRP